MFGTLALLALPLLAHGAPAPAYHATPAPRGIISSIEGALGDGATGATTALTASAATSQFLRPALFAQASYCSTAAVEAWKCGPPCDSLGSDVTVIKAGGNDGTIPGYFVALDPSQDAVVVSHQGTDAKNIMSILNDAKFAFTSVNSTLFPDVSDDVQVHDGFAYTQGRTADDVLAAVQGAVSSGKASKVLIHGHSLGAAIAVMDAVMLRKALDPSVPVSTTVFGLPRGGNQAYADLLDATLGSNIQYITNQHDPVPEVPPRLIDYVHGSGEVHIAAADATSGAPTTIVSCPGQDNVNCATGNNLLTASVGDHKGPYFQTSIIMSHGGCPL